MLVFPYTIKGMVTEQTFDGSLGAPVSGAKISAYLNSTLITTATSGSDGKFSLDIGDNIGRYRIVAEKEDYMNGGIDGLDVKGDYTMFNDDLTMALIKYSTVHGVVTCGGNPAEGVTVHAIAPGINKTTTTNDNGHYSFNLQESVSYNITAEKYGCLPGGVNGVRPHNNSIDINLAIDESAFRKEENVSANPENQSVNISMNDTTVNANNNIPQPQTEDNTLLIVGAVIVIIVLIVLIGAVAFVVLKKRK